MASLLALAACGRSEPTPSASSPEPRPRWIAFTAADAERLVARIDQDPEQAVLLLEQVVASSIASLTDEQFEELGTTLIELLDEGRLQRLVRAGRETPATSQEVARLLDDLEAWDASILRGADAPDLGYLGR